MDRLFDFLVGLFTFIMISCIAVIFIALTIGIVKEVL